MINHTRVLFSCALVAATAGAARADYLANAPSVPAPDYEQGTPVSYPGGILERNTHLTLTSATVAPPSPGSTSTVELFFDVFEDISFDGGNTWNGFHTTSPADITIKYDGFPGGANSTVLALGGQEVGFVLVNMLGGQEVGLRESPTKQQLGGTTTFTDLGGGETRISSFFDVFTELSLDGGQNWLPADQAMHFSDAAVPEPASLALLGLGGLTLLRRRRRA